MHVLFQMAAGVSVVISALILFTLVRGAIDFLRLVPLGDLIDDAKKPGWFPRRERFDLPTVLWGSVIMGLIAMVVAVPFGIGTAVYLAEYASSKVRKIVKPMIEVLAGMPSVVVGFFALKFIAPDLVSPIFHPDKVQNMTAAGIGIGILIIPIMASVSEDAPLGRAAGTAGSELRRRRTQVVDRGEGGAARRSVGHRGRVHHRGVPSDRRDDGGHHGRWPRRQWCTYHFAARAGPVDHCGTDQRIRWHDGVNGGAPYQVLFFLGLLLFALTMILNLIGDRFVRRVRQKY